MGAGSGGFGWGVDGTRRTNLVDTLCEFDLTQDDRIDLENRITKLEATIGLFKWAVSVVMIAFGVIVPFVVYLIESANSSTP
ncbi:MAG: hypothetical protein OXT07_05620 [bacterium]|nr:hypothetical protein [bacterium]